MPKKQEGTKSNKWKYLIGLGLIVCIILGFAMYANTGALSPFGTTTDTSTFRLISYRDGEDVSNFVEISVWVPDELIENAEDIYTLSNFEEKVSSSDADDISIDLSSYSYAWIEVDPDNEAVFENEFYLISCLNGLYVLYAHHFSTDVNFNILDVTTMDEWDKAADGNFTLALDFPHYTVTNLHGGSDDWAITSDDVDEMSTAELQDYWNEQNWRCQAPIYDPGNDTEKDFGNDLERLTNAFAIEFDFNDTVSTTDAAVTQVNMTIADLYDEVVDIIISGDKIYTIFTETIIAPYSFDFEILMAANITCSTVKSGRIAVPQDDDNLGAFTAYSTLQA